MKWTLSCVTLWVLRDCRHTKKSVHSANSESFHVSPYAAWNNEQLKKKGVSSLVGCIGQTHIPKATVA